MTAPREDAGDSSPLAPPVGGSNEPQDARLAEVLERSNLLLGALRLSDSPSESPAGTFPTVNTTLLRRRRRPEEVEEAKEDSELREMAQMDTAPTTAGTSTTLSEAVPDNPGTPSSPNDRHPNNQDETSEGPFYVDLIDEDDQQQRRPMRRRRSRSRERSDDIMAAAAQESNAADGGDTTTATTSMSATELLAPRVSERHVSAFYQNIMAQVYLLEEQEGTRPRHNNNSNGPNRRINTRGARGA